jgi:hypothetical protein
MIFFLNNNMKKVILVLVLITVAATNKVFACCGAEAIRGGAVSGPINTIPAYTIPKGNTIIQLGLQHQNNGRLNGLQQFRIKQNGTETEDSYGILRPSISVAHGITDRFTMAINVPYFMNFDIKEHEHGDIEDYGDSIGWGDISLIGEYNFLKSEKHKFNAAVLAGMKFPTGNADVKNNEGKYFSTQEQPGSGSFDPMFGAALSKSLGQFNFDANFLYKLTTEGKQNIDIGDVQSYNVAVSYPVHRFFESSMSIKEKVDYYKNRELNFVEKIVPEHIFGVDVGWDLVFEVNTTVQGAPEENGVPRDNYGNTTVLLSPGLRMIVDNKWIANFSIGFPVIDERKGIQGGQDLNLYLGLATFF